MDDQLREVLSEVANALQSAHSFATRQRALAAKSVETAEAMEKAISRAVEAFQRLQKEQRR